MTAKIEVPYAERRIMSAATSNTYSDTLYKKLEVNPEAKGVLWLADRSGKWVANAVVGIPVQILAGLLDTIMAYGLSVKAIASWGANKKALHGSTAHHLAAGRSLGYIYLSALKIVFPWAKVPSSAQKFIQAETTDPTLVKNGLLVHEFSIRLSRQVDSLANDKNWAVRNIASRALWIVGTIGRLILRIVDFVIGVFAAIGSIFCLGMCATLNNTAARGLQITHIFTSDLYTGVMKTIDPRFFTRSKPMTTSSMNLSSNS